MTHETRYDNNRSTWASKSITQATILLVPGYLENAKLSKQLFQVDDMDRSYGQLCSRKDGLSVSQSGPSCGAMNDRESLGQLLSCMAPQE